MAQKSIPKSIIFVMPLGIDFWVDFDGFWVPKWTQVCTKMGSNIDVNFERRVFKKIYLSHGKSMVFEIQWVEVGSNNRPNIDPKMDSKMETILASIFHRFWLIFGANMASKIRENPWKVDAKLHSVLDSIFGSIFDRFLVPTSTPRTFKIIVFSKKKWFFKKSPFEVGIDL